MSRPISRALRLFLAFAVILTGSVPAAEAPKPVKVFIFAGQSNMVGSDAHAKQIDEFPMFKGAAAPQTDASPAEAGSYDLMARVSTLLSTSARLGLSRLAAQSSFDSLPSPSREDVRARLATADNLRTTIDEYVQASASMQEAAALTDLGHKPLVVLTAGSGSAPTWATSQHHLATLSTNSVHRVIESATHQTLIADERDAARTSEAVLDVVSSVRSAQPLLP